MRTSAERFLDQLLRASRVRRWHAAPGATTERKLGVARLSRARGRELIGELTCEGGTFVFRYLASYGGPPIPEFPRKDRSYRSGVLWTFFAVRIPPIRRPDVQEILKGINRDHPLEVLATLGGLSVTNPYEMCLVGEGTGRSLARIGVLEHLGELHDDRVSSSGAEQWAGSELGVPPRCLSSRPFGC